MTVMYRLPALLLLLGAGLAAGKPKARGSAQPWDWQAESGSRPVFPPYPAPPGKEVTARVSRSGY